LCGPFAIARKEAAANGPAPSTQHTHNDRIRRGGGAEQRARGFRRNIFSVRTKKKSSVVAAGERREHGTMACCRALALHLLPASAPSLRAPRARIGSHRPRPSPVRCCAAAGDQAEPPQDTVLKAISREESSLLLLLLFLSSALSTDYP